MNKNSDSILSDLDDETVEEISSMVNGMDDKMKERIIDKCTKKMAHEEKTTDIRVSRPHKLYRPAIATAAGLIIFAGIGILALNRFGKVSNSETSLKTNSDNSINYTDKECADDREMEQAADNAPVFEEDNKNEDSQNGQTENAAAGEVTTQQEITAPADENNIQTDIDQIADDLIKKYYKVYTMVCFGNISSDTEDFITIEGSNFDYCKVTDPDFKTIADIELLINSCFTLNAADQKGFSEKLHGEYSKFVEQGGTLYVENRPAGWPVNLTDTPPQIQKISDSEYSVIKEYDNFGAIEHITFDIVNTDKGWKINSYTGDYENVTQ